MARKHYYIDNEEIAEEDAFDENGIIRDGVTTRFPMFMTDSEGRTLVDAMGAPLDPSYTRRGYVFADNSNRERPIDDNHPDVQKAYLSNAWKGGVKPGDVVTIDGRTLVGARYTDDDQTGVEFYSIADGDQLRKNAYDEGVRAMNNACKNKPKKEQKEPSDREWEISGPLSDSEGAELKEQARRDSVEELQNAWRK